MLSNVNIYICIGRLFDKTLSYIMALKFPKLWAHCTKLYCKFSGNKEKLKCFYTSVIMQGIINGQDISYISKLGHRIAPNLTVICNNHIK